jgi:hypothetical protein
VPRADPRHIGQSVNPMLRGAEDDRGGQHTKRLDESAARRRQAFSSTSAGAVAWIGISEEAVIDCFPQRARLPIDRAGETPRSLIASGGRE